MKFVAIICEFNPFHNGHANLIRRIREERPEDGILCVMSGNFTQRGEAAVLDKFTRAVHAVKGGADAVVSLPAPFSTAPAEIFAAGAAKIVCSLPCVETLAFGCECGDLGKLCRAAEITSDGDGAFGDAMKRHLSLGESYQRSAEKAYIECGGERDVLNRSNNILAVEYVRALRKYGFRGDVMALKREGSDHMSRTFNAESRVCSSGAIREDLRSSYIPSYVPGFVVPDIAGAKNFKKKLTDAERLCVLRDDEENLRRIYGCTEGLENTLKSLCLRPAYELIPQAAGKRYSESRITRILCSELLKIYRDDCEEYLGGDLYVKPLAVNADRADEILSSLGTSSYPLLIRGRDAENLSDTARKCMDSDLFADTVYAYLGGETQEYFSLRKPRRDQ